MEMSKIEKLIYNEGERLIPGVTHDMCEVIRHKSSYAFFRIIIQNDIKNGFCTKPFKVLDFGCGVGHGCLLLSQIPDIQVVGVEISRECIDYASKYYEKSNVEYRLVQENYFETMPEYDYIVSRGVVEHIPNGIETIVKMRWSNRLLFNVPYNELPGNPHHYHLGITEDDFSTVSESELYYEDLSGVTYDEKTKPESPNMINCICSKPFLPPVAEMQISFPIAAWEGIAA